MELLRNRNITGEAEIGEFLSEKPQRTYNPFLLHNLEAGVDFLLSAVRSGKRVCIYGDYDADGVTSVALMRQILSHLTDRISHYIPSRFDEGYGLNIDAIDTIKARGTDVILTVDCGSISCDEVVYARQRGMDVIVTDHHSINDQKADCILINPKQKECDYPFPYLAGVGVAFKFAQGIQQKAGLPKHTVNQLLDLVAIGTIGDIVPLTDENRTMVKYGLNILNTGARPGIASLMKAIASGKEKISSENVAFEIVPHINAAGRIGNAEVAVQAITAESTEAASRDVGVLIERNTLRKKMQAETYETCITLAETQCAGDDFKLIEANDAHEGIAGIVAGKIKDRYARPSVIVTDSGDGTVKGTGRSPESVNLYTLLTGCADLFTQFGGHAGACGFTMDKENVPALRQRTNDALHAMAAENPAVFDLQEHVDLILSPADITEELVKETETLAPFGNGNPKPVFMLRNLTVSNIAYMGNNKQHVRFTAGDRSGASVQCILFARAGEFTSLLESGMELEVLGTAEYTEWNGKGRVQIIVTGLRGTEV